MIQILENMPEGVLGVEAVGKLTTNDYKDVFAPALAAAIAAHNKVRIVFIIEGEFGGMEVGAMWEDLKTGIKDWNHWERIALVTDQRWIREGLHLFGWAVPGQVKTFEPQQRQDAIDWTAAN
jgi:hypothetical protein